MIVSVFSLFACVGCSPAGVRKGVNSYKNILKLSKRSEMCDVSLPEVVGRQSTRVGPRPL